MKEMCVKLPEWGCPICSSKRFIVSEYKATNYLLNSEGIAVEFQEKYYGAAGICLKCHNVFQMMPTINGFIPLTPLRKLYFDYKEINDLFNDTYIPIGDESNPMEKCHES